LVGIANKNSNQWRDSSGVRLTTYFYRIRIFKQNSGNSNTNTGAWVGPVSATTLGNPSAPSNLTLFVAGDRNINLSWRINDDEADGFSIFRATNAAGPFVRIDSIRNEVLSSYQDKNLNPNTTYFYKVRAFNDELSAFSNIANATTFLSSTPSSANWRLPIVANSFSSTFNGGDEFAGLEPRRNVLKQKLEEGKDFLNFIRINANQNSSFSFRMPDASEFPNGGMITYNVSTPSMTNNVLLSDTLFFRVDNLNYGVRLFISDDGINYTEQSRPWKGPRGNDLQKIDLPVAFANKYVRITFENPNSGIPLYFTEIGMYKFLGSGVRHNYFILTGASIEEQSMPMGLTKFRERIKSFPDLATMGENLVIFNWAVSGSASQELLDSLPKWLARHPNAGYVMVHQGGNNINNTANGMRPLTYDKRVNFPGVKVFENTFRDFFLKVYEAGKIPFVSRMHFRDYRAERLCAGDLLNGPDVRQGRIQENGSLPYNLLIDSITKVYAPFAYNQIEQRSGINFYPITLNEQWMIGGDGLHPSTPGSTDAGSINNSRYIINKLADYWINHTIRYAYTGTFAPAIQYNPDNQVRWECWFRCNTCGPANDLNRWPRNKPNLTFKCDSAVQVAEMTKSGEAIWNARVLVEQLGNRDLRVNHVLRLDSLQDFRNPVNPQFLQLSVVNSTSLALNWLDNSPNETAFEVWMKTNNGAFQLISTLPANTTEFQVTGLNSDNEYTFYVRARNNNFKSGWSNLVVGRPFATYYSKSTGNLNDLNTWGLAPTGAGLSPTSFTQSGQKFVITNRTQNNPLNGDLTVSGNNSVVVIAAGQKLTVPQEVTLNAKVEVNEGSTLEILSNSLPEITKLDTTAHLIYGGEVTIPNLVYGDLTLVGGTAKMLTTGATYNVKGNLRINEHSALYSIGNTTLNLGKNLIYSSSEDLLHGPNLILAGGSQTIDAKGGLVNVKSLILQPTSNLNVLNASKIEVLGNVNIQDTSKLRLNNGTLSITGSYNSTNKTGKMFVNNGSLEFFGSSPLISELYFDSTQNKLFNLKVSQSNGSVNLNSFVEVYGTISLLNGELNTKNNLVLAATLENHGKIGRVGTDATLLGTIESRQLIGPFKRTSTYYIGTPILNQRLATWRKSFTLMFRSAGSNVSTFNEPSNSFNFVLDSNLILIPGRGYSVTIPVSDFKSEFTSLLYKNEGYPLVGDGQGDNDDFYDIPVSYTSSNKGWNLVSNPYPCDINWDNSVGYDKNDIENMIYYYDGNSRQYRVYLGGTGIVTNGAGPIIMPGQGFMIKSKRNGYLKINEDSKIEDFDGTYNFFKQEDKKIAQKSFLNIMLKNGSSGSDLTTLIFDDEENYDLEKLNNNNGLNISTIDDNNKKLAVQTVKGGQEVRIPIDLNTPSNGQFQLAITDENCRQFIESVHLRDKYLDTYTPILYGLETSFEVNTDVKSKSDRFELVIKVKPLEKVTSLNISNHKTSKGLPYPNPFKESISIDISSKGFDNATVEVSDLNGIRKFEKVYELNGGANKINLSYKEVWNSLSKGTYILKIKRESGKFDSYLVSFE
ncbi:MAG: fibronectin type III domain-containing protein, partial [Cytophagales bacterium]